MSISTSSVTLAEPVEPPARRRWLRVVISALVLILALVVIASVVTAPYVELVPGDALSVSGLITVPAGKAQSIHGKVLLTDVGVNQLHYIGLPFAWLDPNAAVVSSADLTGNLPFSEFDAEGTVDMEESQMTAEAVALRQLGYQVPESDVGVTVYVIDPRSPAWHVLRVGDVVTAVDGIPTHNPEDLVNAVHSHRPGDRVTLRVGSISQPTPGRDVTLTLAPRVDQNGTKVPFIGIGDPDAPIPSMGTQPSYAFPFSVDIKSDQIGGPSAGLAFTLAIVDELAGGDITGGRVVAATGTIHPDGSVGDVGGVEQKTVAVEQAHASVFLVPKDEAKAAQAKAGAGLRVVGVSDLSDALEALSKLGGRLGPASSGPPSGPGGNSVPFDWQDAPWS